MRAGNPSIISRRRRVAPFPAQDVFRRQPQFVIEARYVNWRRSRKSERFDRELAGNLPAERVGRLNRIVIFLAVLDLTADEVKTHDVPVAVGLSAGHRQVASSLEKDARSGSTDGEVRLVHSVALAFGLECCRPEPQPLMQATIHPELPLV